MFGLGQRPRAHSGGYRDLIHALQLFEPEIKERRVRNLNQDMAKLFGSKNPGEPLGAMDLQQLIRSNPKVDPQDIMQQFKAFSDMRKRNYYYGLGQKLQEQMQEWKARGVAPNRKALQEFYTLHNVSPAAQAEFTQILEEGVAGDAFRLPTQKVVGSGLYLVPETATGPADVKTLIEPTDKKANLSQLGKLLRERNALPEGSPQRKIYDAKISELTSGSEKGGKDFDWANKLRNKYIDLSKDFIKVRDSYGRVIAATNDPSPAGDLALIFNYMKILDPGSVVRESEFRTAALSGSYGERIKAAVQKALKGTRMSETMRLDFLDRAKRLYKAQERMQTHLSDTYSTLAKTFGLDPSTIAVDLSGRFAPSSMSGKKTIPETSHLPPEQQLTEDDLEKLLKKYPQSPRDQIIDAYLKGL